jgi:hypothetical protein
MGATPGKRTDPRFRGNDVVNVAFVLVFAAVVAGFARVRGEAWRRCLVRAYDRIDVIPAKAGIHLAFPRRKAFGFPRSRE